MVKPSNPDIVWNNYVKNDDDDDDDVDVDDDMVTLFIIIIAILVPILWCQRSVDGYLFTNLLDLKFIYLSYC